jgi:hypothetical protein
LGPPSSAVARPARSRSAAARFACSRAYSIERRAVLDRRAGPIFGSGFGGPRAPGECHRPAARVTNLTAVAQRQRRELVFMPQSGPLLDCARSSVADPKRLLPSSAGAGQQRMAPKRAKWAPYGMLNTATPWLGPLMAADECPPCIGKNQPHAGSNSI